MLPPTLPMFDLKNSEKLLNYSVLISLVIISKSGHLPFRNLRNSGKKYEIEANASKKGTRQNITNVIVSMVNRWLWT